MPPDRLGRSGTTGRLPADLSAQKSRGRAASAARRPTVVDVAHAAGVSPMTVSNVVNGRFGAMSKDTRKAVEAAIRQLGYRPQATGRNLKLARRFSIGMVVVDESPTFLADAFITQLVAGLSNFLSRRDYGLVLQGMTADRVAQSSLLRRHETDALCLMLSGPAARRRRLVGRIVGLGHPVVLFQQPAPPSVALQVVRQDDSGGARDLARLLLDRGADDIVFLVPSLAWPAIEERERGIRAAVKAARRRVRFAVIPCGDGSLAATQSALARHVAREGMPAAVMGGNDQMGMAALKWLRDQGRAVPGDVLVTGFNAFEAWQYTSPVLTTVVSPAYEMGAKAGESLLDRLQGKSFDRPEHLFPVRLQPGGST